MPTPDTIDATQPRAQPPSNRTSDRRACRRCGGDGTLTYVGGPGTFDEHDGVWIPSETQEPCPACRHRAWTRARPVRTPTDTTPATEPEPPLPF